VRYVLLNELMVDAKAIALLSVNESVGHMTTAVLITAEDKVINGNMISVLGLD